MNFPAERSQGRAVVASSRPLWDPNVRGGYRNTALRFLGFLAVLPLMSLILLYQRLLRPLLPPTCRFYPTCSDYALVALRRYGLFKGVGLTVWRLCRCHPFHAGGVDPVPERPMK